MNWFNLRIESTNGDSALTIYTEREDMPIRFDCTAEGVKLDNSQIETLFRALLFLRPSLKQLV